MKYIIKFENAGYARDVDTVGFTHLSDSQDIDHVLDDIGWDLELEERPTAMWVQVEDGDYGTIYATFSVQPWSIYATLYRVDRIREDEPSPIDAGAKYWEGMVDMPEYARETLRGIVGVLDTQRDILHDLCQHDEPDNMALAILYKDLTDVADSMYRISYRKDRE